MDSIKEQFRDRIILCILGAGVVTTLVAPWVSAYSADENTTWFDGLMEGDSILIAVVVIVALTAGNDYLKDKQFSELQASCKDEECTVIRGKSGATQSINTDELVVGDCILVEAGARVPADCILVEGTDVSVNSSYYHNDEPNREEK